MKQYLLGATILTACLSFDASAAILGATTASGLDLTRGGTEANVVVGYNELQDVAIDADSVYVDYLAGTNMSTGNSYVGVSHSTSGLTLDAGTYDSHILHFDPIGRSGGTAQNANGTDASVTFSFDGDIVGVIVGTEYLNASDDIFGNAAAYNNNIDRRLEPHDLFTFTADSLLTVNLARVSSQWIDNIRVITDPSATRTNVSEPATIAMLGLGLLATAGLRRRK